MTQRTDRSGNTTTSGEGGTTPLVDAHCGRTNVNLYHAGAERGQHGKGEGIRHKGKLSMFSLRPFAFSLQAAFFSSLLTQGDSAAAVRDDAADAAGPRSGGAQRHLCRRGMLGVHRD